MLPGGFDVNTFLHGGEHAVLLHMFHSWFYHCLQEAPHPLLVSALSFDGQSVSEFYDAAETLSSQIGKSVV